MIERGLAKNETGGAFLTMGRMGLMGDMRYMGGGRKTPGNGGPAETDWLTMAKREGGLGAKKNECKSLILSIFTM